MAKLVRQVKDLSDHFLALSWRLDLQEQMLTQRLHEVRMQCCLGKGSLGRGLPAPPRSLKVEAQLPGRKPPSDCPQGPEWS